MDSEMVMQFQNMAQQVIQIMERMAVQAAEAGNRINRNLFHGAGPAAHLATAQTQRAMAGMQQSAGAAGAAVARAGQQAGGAAGGYQRNASAAMGAAGANQTFVQRMEVLFGRLGQFGRNVTGIVNGVQSITTVIRRFRGQAGPVQQVANAVQATGAAAAAVVPKKRNLARSIIMVTKVVSTAGLAVLALARSYKALKAAPLPAKFPDVGKGIQKSLTGSMPGISSAISGIGAMLAASVAAVGIGKLISDSVLSAVSSEQLHVSMDVMLGGMEQAKAMILDLRRRADASPYTSDDYTSAGRSLIAFGEDAEKVADTLDRLSDITAGIGGSSATYGDIAEIYGKAKVQGQLFAEDINQLTGRGIPVIQEFAKQLGVSTTEVKKMGSEGKIRFEHLEQAFIDLTSAGGKFEGLGERLSMTTGGMWSTMLGKISNVRLALGTPINDQIRPLLAAAIEGMEKASAVAATLGSGIADGLRLATGSLQVLGSSGVLDILGDALILGFQEATNVLYAGIMGALGVLGAGMGAAAMVLIQILHQTTKPEFWSNLGSVLKSIALTFGAMLLDGVASMAEGVKKIPGMGALVGTLPDEMRVMAGGMRTSAAADLKAGKPMLDPILAEAKKQFENLMKALGPAFMEGYNNTPGLFDTTEERAGLAKTLEDLRASIATMEETTKEVAKDAVKKEEEKKSKAGDAAKGGAIGGYFASAINLLMGRGPNELLLDEARRQTTALEKIAANTGKPTPKPPAPVVVNQPIDMTARFA